MPAAKKPADESARLRALRSCAILDTEPEPVFDDLTRLVADRLSVPIVAVSLVDEHRQWFKSKVGLAVDETPRDHAFCAYAIQGTDVLVVADATLDARFVDNPLVTGVPGIRAYAGAPIELQDGYRVGTVCAIATAPRSWGDADLDMLRLAARQVAKLLELARSLQQERSTQRKLRDVTERLDLVVGAACDGVWEIDAIAGTIELSTGMSDLLGLPDLEGPRRLQELLPIVYPADRRTVERAALRQLRRGVVFDVEVRCRHVTGGWRWYRARAATAPSADGRARRLVGSLTDVHSHRSNQEHLQRLSRLLAESQALARVGGWELDLTTNDLFWTAETYRIHETSPKSYHPNVDTAIDFYAPESQPLIRAALEQAIESGRPFSLDLELITARGRRIWARATGCVVFAGGRAVRVMGAFQDISAQRRQDEELVRAKEAAEAASEAKSAFLAAMSHEIRTPMHTVLGYTDMLRDTGLSQEQRECVDTITASGKSLLRLIDDILDFSKSEAGKMQLEKACFDVCGVVAEVVRMMESLAAQKRLELRVEREGDRAIEVYADQQRVQQVLLNLVGNAVKFTADGSVCVSLERRDEEVVVRVRDTGIGIPPVQLPRLFLDFVQVDSSTRRQFGGTGLGLAISKQLVEAMGGRIGVESREGEGSTFWFTVPLASTEGAVCAVLPPTAQPEASEVDLDTHGRRVLVVEDNRLNQRLAVRVLEQFGFEVDTANDGHEAVRKVADERFDLVLMDCLMPGMDGFEATRRIREREAETGQRVPIIALTANAMVEDRRKCLASGMDDFVAKPFTRHTLQQATSRWLLG